MEIVSTSSIPMGFSFNKRTYVAT